MDFGEVDIAELTYKQSVVWKALHRVTEGNNSTSTIKKQAFEAGKTSTFNLTTTNQIFDTLPA